MSLYCNQANKLYCPNWQLCMILRMDSPFSLNSVWRISKKKSPASGFNLPSTPPKLTADPISGHALSVIWCQALLIPNRKSTRKGCRRLSLPHKSFSCNIVIKDNVDPQVKWKRKKIKETESRWCCISLYKSRPYFNSCLGQTSFLSLGRQETDTICTYKEGWSFNNVTA